MKVHPPRLCDGRGLDRRASLRLALCLVLLAGCATVTFKRGASPDTMAADERACRAATKGEAAYEQCMRDRGWFVARPGEGLEAEPGHVPVGRPKAPAGAGAAPAYQRSARPVAVAAPVQDEPAKVAVPAAAGPPAKVPAQAETPPGAAPLPEVPRDHPASAEAATADPPDMLARVDVASWWKLGGSAADLDRAIEACVGDLGAAHRPEPGARIVTTGMRACLRARGWYAFGGSGAR